MDTIEQNKAAVREYIDRLFSNGDAEGASVFISPSFVNHDPPMGQSADRDGMSAASALIRRSFPDWHSHMTLLVGEGDYVIEQFTATGTHTGAPFFGFEASGRSVALQGINIFRFEDGTIVERWGRVDESGLQQQLASPHEGATASLPA